MKCGESITSLFKRKAFATPQKTAIVFIDSSGIERSFTYEQLFLESYRFSNLLVNRNIRTGDFVIISLPHGVEQVCAFWGALFAGAVPAIVQEKGMMVTEEAYASRLMKKVNYVAPFAVVTTGNVAKVLKRDRLPDTVEILEWEDVPDTVQLSEIDSHGEQLQEPGNIAYLQFTSGTTGVQKGVLLEYDALSNAALALQKIFRVDSNDVIVNWLPLFHDGGLIAGMLLPLLYGATAILLSPFTWLRRPNLLFQAITEFKATYCWMTNSACNHAVDYIRDDDVQTFDLCSLRGVLVSAERIVYEHLQRFQAKFAPCGFDSKKWIAGYGLAENGLSVAITEPGAHLRVDWVNVKSLQEKKKAICMVGRGKGVTPIISCGENTWGTEIRIVDEENRPLKEEMVGEIAIKGKTLFRGYYKNPEQTDTTTINGWYLTGDIGYLSKKQLYVCGRKKDTIIVAGKNLFPDDIEQVVGRFPLLYDDRVAVFGIWDSERGTEQVVTAAEISSKASDSEKRVLEKKIRELVFQEFDVVLRDVILVKRGWLERTTNGKVKRKASSEKYIKQYLSENRCSRQ